MTVANHHIVTGSKAGHILAERVKDGITWQARISQDRGRLEVIGRVPASAVETEIRPLTEAELLELLGEAPHPVAEDTRRKRTGGHDEARSGGRRLQLRARDSVQHEVADGAPRLPPLEAVPGGDPFGPGGRVEILQGREPVEARDAVAGLAAAIGVEEVVGEGRRVPLGEAQLSEPLLRLHAGGQPRRRRPAPAARRSTPGGHGGGRPDRAAR